MKNNEHFGPRGEVRQKKEWTVGYRKTAYKDYLFGF